MGTRPTVSTATNSGMNASRKLRTAGTLPRARLRPQRSCYATRREPNARKESGAMSGAMRDYPALEQDLRQALGLIRRPVAITFAPDPPDGVPRFSGKEPAGCAFWRLAAEGDAFYTVPGDHFNCAIGSYTHGITLSPERAKELEQTLAFMTGIGYIRM